MAVQLSITDQDWLTAKKYGCKLSYAEFLKMYESQKVAVELVVGAWILYFMENGNEERKDI